MAVDILEAEVFWRDSAHPMLQFMAETIHPDIRTFGLMKGDVGEAGQIGLR
jgi:hypothetical protein